MTLAVDIGNTHIVFGLMKNGKVERSWRVATNLNKTADEYFSILQGLLLASHIQMNGTSQMVGVSVVPPLDTVFEEVAAQLKLPFRMLTHETIPIPIRIPNPDEVGTDRLVNAFAARELYGKPAIVIDFGTATTFDAISAKGEYLGGAIAPGLGIGRDALYEKTAKLPKVDLHAPRSAIGKGTEDAMRSGLLLGYAGLVEKIVEAFTKELGQEAKIITTGGFVELIKSQTKVIETVDQDLTLKGLALLSK